MIFVNLGCLGGCGFSNSEFTCSICEQQEHFFSCRPWSSEQYMNTLDRLEFVGEIAH